MYSDKLKKVIESFDRIVNITMGDVSHKAQTSAPITLSVPEIKNSADGSTYVCIDTSISPTVRLPELSDICTVDSLADDLANYPYYCMSVPKGVHVVIQAGHVFVAYKESYNKGNAFFRKGTFDVSLFLTFVFLDTVMLAQDRNLVLEGYVSIQVTKTGAPHYALTLTDCFWGHCWNTMPTILPYSIRQVMYDSLRGTPQNHVHFPSAANVFYTLQKSFLSDHIFAQPEPAFFTYQGLVLDLVYVCESKVHKKMRFTDVSDTHPLKTATYSVKTAGWLWLTSYEDIRLMLAEDAHNELSNVAGWIAYSTKFSVRLRKAINRRLETIRTNAEQFDADLSVLSIQNSMAVSHCINEENGNGAKIIQLEDAESRIGWYKLPYPTKKSEYKMEEFPVM